jgi:hypothetical protein
VITVLPEGGLCNRLRVVASSWLLAQRAGQPMTVLWNRAPDFNARFDALFETAGLPFAVREGVTMNKATRALARSREWWSRLAGLRVLGEAATAPGRFDLERELPGLRGRDVFVHTNSRLAAAPGMFDIFLPTGEAATRLLPLRERLAHSVGVHVRRTDNTKAAAVSTLSHFITRMKAAQAPGLGFFVATDEPQVLQQLRAEFGDAVWEYPKRAYARNDPLAIVDALVDLTALAACRQLIGSYWSSFTDTAAEWRGIPLVIAREGA